MSSIDTTLLQKKKYINFTTLIYHFSRQPYSHKLTNRLTQNNILLKKFEGLEIDVLILLLLLFEVSSIYSLCLYVCTNVASERFAKSNAIQIKLKFYCFISNANQHSRWNQISRLLTQKYCSPELRGIYVCECARSSFTFFNKNWNFSIKPIKLLFITDTGWYDYCIFRVCNNCVYEKMFWNWKSSQTFPIVNKFQTQK